MNCLAVWPYAIPMNSSGKMIDDYQGIYSRGLCRAFAEGLLRTRLCEVAACLPIVTIDGVTSWAVTGKEWSLDEVLEKPLPEGIEFVTVGTMSIAERVELHVRLVSRSRRSLLLDQHFGYPRARFLDGLSEVVAVMAATIVGRRLSEEENQRLQRWGTSSPEAYLAYLEAWSAAAACRFGVTVPNPHAALECARKASGIDPNFAEASKLQEQLNLMEVESQPREAGAGDLNGYLEFACRVSLPGTT
jgi:hypothetical protein